ncbi:MAG: GGDEF domain-containing protein [Spirochaetales bacterium]|nr:GGDEF domain-containing protein [Spirochaetales bacterium]
MFSKGPFPFLLFLLSATFLFSQDYPLAEQGVLDLREVESTDIQPLFGEWEFIAEGGERFMLTVPGGWEEVSGYNFGKGRYRLTILRSPSPREVAFFMPELSQKYKVTSNGRIIYNSIVANRRSGKFSRPILVLGRETTLVVEIELDNSFFREGGLHHAPLYGSFNDIMQIRNRNIITETAIVSIALFIFLYNLFLYLMKYSDISALYLGLGALAFALRGLFEGEYIAELLFPTFSKEISYRANFCLLYLGMSAMTLFLFKVFSPRRKFTVRMIYGLCFFAVALAVASALVPMRVLSLSIYVIQSYGLVLLLICLFMILWGVKNRREDSWIILIGILILLAFGIADIWSIHGNLRVVSGTQKGLILLLLALFVVITRKFGRAYFRAEKLSHDLEGEVARQTEELKKLSFTDSLTGVNNRRRFLELAQREVIIHRRHKRSLGVMMMDLDHFKLINDRYGHSCGDKALVYLARLCTNEIRESDILGRLGGEEFAVILLETELSGAHDVAERIRRKLEESTLRRNDDIPPMTISIGLVLLQDGESLEEAMARADALMYSAKKGGRNRIAY